MNMEYQKGVEILDKFDGKEEKGIEILEKRLVSDAIRDEINGEMCSEENSKLNVSIGEERVAGEAIKPIGSPPSTTVPGVNGDGTGEKHEAGSSSSTPKKGHGLKKWRRIRREMNNYGSAGSDSSLILKRRHSLNEPSRSRNDTKLKNEAESEVEIETQIPSVGSPRSVEVTSLAPELVQFAIGMVDSDNSEDRSSKSSTAASVPKPRHEIGFGRERGRLKNQGGKGVGATLQQRGQRGKGDGDVEASRKFRGNRIRLQKENSLSSIESDLRSSNVGFARWGSGVSNGKQSEKSLNFDGEQIYESQMRSGYYKENGRVEDLSREDFDGDLLEKESNGRSSFRQSSINSFRQSSGIDPFIGSIVLLQTAQEALELEIQKFAEIGKKAALHNLDDQFEETEVSSSPSLEEAHLLELNQEIEQLQYKLEEASTTAKAMGTKVLELEAILNRTQSRKKESTYPPPFQEMNQGLEFELESLLKKKIEAEIELLIVSRTTQSWKLLAEDQIALFEEQESLAGDQAQMSLKMKETKNRAIKLKDRAHELDSYCKELLQTEKALKLQNKVCKFSLCLFLQLLLLCFALGLFLVQPLLPSHEVVPT